MTQVEEKASERTAWDDDTKVLLIEQHSWCRVAQAPSTEQHTTIQHHGALTSGWFEERLPLPQWDTQ
jgi:hypothetical protein